MLGTHRLTQVAAALVVGFGALFGMIRVASAVEFPVMSPASFQFASPPYGYFGLGFANGAPFLSEAKADNAVGGPQGPLSTFDGVHNSPRHYGNRHQRIHGDDAFVLTFADIWAGPAHFLSQGKTGNPHGHGNSIDVASLPIPSTVWLFLAALALLFGISRRRNSAGR